MFRFYHNRQGHFGVQKTAALLSDRFFWKSPRALRDEVAAFIRRCPVCSRTKVPRHKAGAAGALPVGASPFDVTSAATSTKLVGLPLKVTKTSSASRAT
ncbi:hypothetical protein AB1Y20_007016 [Prymnesium parvum]|uniref:Integrase zinc-binding domain-containing protein n=1 Tax=Prymnesium parvum TaxID=97485 RepID=A0AB34J3D0_PRYPA